MSAELDEAIIGALAAARPSHLSGEALAEVLGISRVSIKGRIDRLREQGFRIDAVRNRGYLLTGEPEHIHAAMLGWCLRQQGVSAQVEVFDQIDSTNSEAERRLAAGAETPLILVARRQASGRGRLGRIWYSEDDSNLYCTLCFRPNQPPGRMQKFTLWMGLTLCAFLDTEFGLPLQSKWPNDLLHEGRKVAGMLTEARMDADTLRELSFGLGLNINSRPQTWPPEVAAVATSLQAINADRPLPINPLAAKLIAALLQAYEVFINQNVDKQLDKLWHRYSAIHGKRVTIIQSGEVGHSGEVIGLGESGSLLLRHDDGSTRTYAAGDVSLKGVYKPDTSTYL